MSRMITEIQICPGQSPEPRPAEFNTKIPEAIITNVTTRLIILTSRFQHKR
jgi:hypothetical protein